MKKILICIYNLQGGGAEKVLINLLNSLDYSKYKVTLLVLRKEGIYLDKINENVNVIYGFKGAITKKLSNKIMKLLPPKILHKMFIKGEFHTEISFLEGFSTKVISGSQANSKKIAWVHADFITYHWTEALFSFDKEKSYYDKYKNIVCVSKSCEESFNKVFNMENKTLTIYNLLDKNLDNYRKFNIKNVFNNDKITKILYVGRIEKEKGVERLLKSYKEVIDMGYKEVKLYILGNGSMKDMLLRYAKDNSLCDFVEFISFKENVYDYMISSDYIVVPSYSESFSLVLGEGVSLNKVCLSTDTIGAREILKNGEYGLIVENSQEGIKNSIIKILEDKSLKDKYLRNIEKGSKIFNREVILNNIYEVID